MHCAVSHTCDKGYNQRSNSKNVPHFLPVIQSLFAPPQGRIIAASPACPCPSFVATIHPALTPAPAQPRKTHPQFESRAMIRLDIFSDPICPWCYIGKAYLDRALEAHAGHPFEIEWHPFQLNPEMPPEGADRRAYLEARFGSKQNAVAIYARVSEAAEAAGLTIAFETMNRVPNTLDAHRLIHWAGLEGRQTAMVSILFRAYFRDGLDIGDKATLAKLAGDAGLDAALAARLLATEADRADLAARDAHARQRGVTSVPTFVIANQYVLTGAQPVALWGQVIDELAAAPEGSSKSAAH